MLTEKKHDQKMVRHHHSLLFFKIIKDHGPISRADLAKRTEMSATSASRIVKDLIDLGFVQEIGKTEGNVGRKATLLEINPTGLLLIGVNIDLESTQVGIVDLYGNVLSVKTSLIQLTRSPNEVLDEVIMLIRKIMEEISELSKRIISIGVSIPGIVEWPEGKVATIPQFHWGNVDIKGYLEEKLHKTVLVDNQVKSILLAESLYGSAAGKKNAACIFVGSGVGGAVMDEGYIIRGSNNAAGEIGHMTIDPNGQLCDCGRIGCLQTFVCSTALEKETGVSIDEIFAAEKRNEVWAVNILNRAAEYLAMTISNVACAYNPEVIILAGFLINDNPEWAKRVEEKYKKYLWGPLKHSFTTSYPQLGNFVGVVGASALVLRGLLGSPFTYPEAQTLMEI